MPSTLFFTAVSVLFAGRCAALRSEDLLARIARATAARCMLSRRYRGQGRRDVHLIRSGAGPGEATLALFPRKRAPEKLWAPWTSVRWLRENYGHRRHLSAGSGEAIRALKCLFRGRIGTTGPLFALF